MQNSIEQFGGAFLVFIILTFVNMFILKSYRYNNPIVICSALCLFLTFLNLKIKNYDLLTSISVAPTTSTQSDEQKPKIISIDDLM